MKITPLKMWVQNVLPVVYDDSLSYYEMVAKINEKTNEIITQVNENTDDIEALNKIIEQLGDVDELKALLEEVETIINDLYTTDIPAMDSENGSAGVANHAARSDHSHPSDNSKANAGLGITGALAGQYVRIKTVDSGVPTEFENYMPHEVPNGGTTGQALRKESNDDYAADWNDVHEIPSGGTTAQALKKNSNTDYDASWSNIHEIPSGGNKDNILVKGSNNNYDAIWTDTPEQMGSLAYINKRSTADRLYNPGEYLVYNGQLYKVGDTAIGQDETLNPSQGGNIKAATVGNALTSAIDVRQIQFNLPETMTLTKLAPTQIVSNIDLKTIGLPTGTIPTEKTLIGAVPLWTNNYVGAGIILDSFVNNGLLSIAGAPTTVDSQTISSLRILTFWK